MVRLRSFRRLPMFLIALFSCSQVAAQKSATPQVVPAIDDQFAAVWREYDLQPSSVATDGEWVRRVYLDLLGRIPTISESGRFVASRDRGKRIELVERLLSDTKYQAEYVRHWCDVWTNLLVGRTGGFENNTLTSRAGLEAYLRGALSENRPYHEMVNDLLSATGTNSPDSEQFNGAVNFLTMKLSEKATLATAQTSQLFLGRQVQCTQCHNHPFNDWKQNQFWEFNSFFRQAVALRRFKSGTRDIRTVELTDQDFRGEGKTPDEAEVYYEQRNGILKAVYPTFLDGTPIKNRSGYLDDMNRRQALAELVCGSPLLAEAIVNRMWSYFLGCGFTTPVDDMGPHNPPSHPGVLNTLARAFENESYDLRQLSRWIVLSKPYSLSSRTNKSNQVDDPALGESPKFSHFYLRQLSPEQLYETMAVLETGAPSPSDLQEVTQQKRRWLRQFSRALGNDEGGESSTFNGTIPQTLMMFNGELSKKVCNLDAKTLLGTVARSDDSFDAKVNRLFAAALSRKATSKELKMGQQLAKARLTELANTAAPSGSRNRRQPPESGEAKAAAEGLRDVLWVLTNSNEFILNH